MYLRSPRWTHPITGGAACLSGAIVLWYHRPLPVDHQTHENYTQPSNCTGKGPTGTACVLLRNNVLRRRSRRGRRWKRENEGTAIRPTTCYIADTGYGYCARADGENTQVKRRVIFFSCLCLSRLSLAHLSIVQSLHSSCHHLTPPCILYILLHITNIYICSSSTSTIKLELYYHRRIYFTNLSPFYPH